MDLLTANDAPGAYPQSYYAATANLPDPGPVLNEAIECDVCVIGAGYTGLSAALHLAEQGKRVVVLDAQRIGWGASGRNGGQLGSGQRLEQAALEQMLGIDKAHQLWEVAEESKALVKSLIARLGIACDLKPGVLHADHKPRFVKDTRQFVAHLNEKYDYQKVRFVPREEMREMVGSTDYHGGALDMDAAHLHPLNFALGLAKAAQAAGVQIFEQSKVTHIKKGDPALVETEKGQVRARFVVLGCNGYIGRLEPKVSARVLPINNYILATEPLEEAMARGLIRDDVAVADSRFVINYFRLSADRRLLFGGGESYGSKFPSDIGAFVRIRMLKVFPQLASARLNFAWGGTLGITVNRMPHVARLAPNILSMAGFSGHGLGMATLSGKLAADVIGGTADRFDIMAGLPSIAFPGGSLIRQPLLALAMLYYSLRDKI